MPSVTSMRSRDLSLGTGVSGSARPAAPTAARISASPDPAASAALAPVPARDGVPDDVPDPDPPPDAAPPLDPAPDAALDSAPAPAPWPPCEQVIGEIDSALNSLSRSLRQGRLHEFLLAEARIDCDQAGLAILYVLHAARTSLRMTDVSDRLHIDAPAVTRKAQQLERSGLITRTRDGADARATRVQLTAQGRRTIGRFLTARKAWLSRLLDNWPAGQQADLARLLRQFAGDVHQHLQDLDS